MRNFRFNIATILGMILLFGIGFAALRESSDLWESGIFTVTLGVLLVAVLVAVHRREAKRAFWIGFALFGWSYIALAQVPSIESRLLTVKGLAYLDSKLHGSNSAGFDFDYDNDGDMDLYVAKDPQPNALYRNLSNGKFQDVRASAGLNLQANKPTTRGTLSFRNSAGMVFRKSSGTPENFVRIGHSLLALVAAWLGGILSRRLHRRSIPPPVSTTSDTEG
jgi:hypothetical protein